MKKCSTCKIEKPLECFGKDKRSKTGLRSQCKECEKKYRINGEKNRDPIKKREYAKRYRETHKEKERRRLDKWKRENPEKYKAYKTTTKSFRRSKVSDGDRDITLLKLFHRDKGICKICGQICDYHDYEIRDKVFIAGNLYPSIDHIKPLSKGGYHTWENIQLAHKVCNSIKNTKEVTYEYH